MLTVYLPLRMVATRQFLPADDCKDEFKFLKEDDVKSLLLAKSDDGSDDWESYMYDYYRRNRIGCHTNHCIYNKHHSFVCLVEQINGQCKLFKSQTWKVISYKNHFLDICDNYEDGLTELQAREIFLEAYSGMHSFSAQDWRLALEADVFVHLGEAVYQHPVFRCLEVQGSSARRLNGPMGWQMFLAVQVLGFMAF